MKCMDLLCHAECKKNGTPKNRESHQPPKLQLFELGDRAF